MQALLDALAQAKNPNLQDLEGIPQIPPSALLDALVTQGANIAGLPMDMAYLAQAGLDAAGVPNPYPLGAMQDVPMTSDWMASKAGIDVEGLPYLAGSAMTPDPGTALKLPDLIQAMTVFHGSPHKWNKVDLSKVGTGEGAQAYGHGFYAAENPDVAREYATVLGDRSGTRVIQSNNESMDLPSWLAAEIEDSGIDSAIMEWEKRIAEFNNQLASPNVMQPWLVKENRNRMQGQLDKMREMKTAGTVDVLEKSHLYELDLPDETIEKMLDWDKPLSEQPESVRKALQGHVDSRTAEKGGNLLLTDGATQHIAEMLKYPDEVKGWELYSTLSDDGFRAAGGLEGSQRQTSELLNSLGIPGIKYYDGSSRNAGKGTRNFVIFDEDAITPLKRNNEPIR